MLENDVDLSIYKNYLLDKIRSGKSYPIKKNLEPKLQFFIPPNVNITHFSSYTYNYICLLLHLLKKFPDAKIPIIPDSQLEISVRQLYRELTEDFREKNQMNGIYRSIIRDYVNHSPILTNHIIIWNSLNSYYFSPYIIQAIDKTVKTHPKTRWILFKISIIIDSGYNHANVLIYDVKSNLMERFDPYGSVYYEYSDQIDSLLRSFLKDYLPNVIYLSPKDTCNGISLQIYSDDKNRQTYVENDPNGFCVPWCLFYLETRLTNPDLDPKILIRKCDKKINTWGSFKDYIRNYSEYLDQIKNEILLKAAIPEKFFYKKLLPMEYYQSYLKYIRREFSEIV